MSQLVLSEDATIELDGKQITLKEGDVVQISKDPSLFDVDSEFEVNTEKGKMLIESGDQIRFGNGHKVLSSASFTSGCKQFVLEEGDSFYVLEEGFWGEFKRAFSGQDPAAETVTTMLGQLIKIGRMIAIKAERYLEEQGHSPEKGKDAGIKTPYENILSSKEYKTILDITKYVKEGLGNESLDISEIIDLLDLDDPIELISKIRDELIKQGDKRLANRIEKMIPKGIIGKVRQVWKNVSGDKMAKGSLTAIGTAEPTKPTQPAKSSKKPDKEPVANIYQALEAYVGKHGITPKSILSFLDKYADKISAKELMAALKWGKDQKPQAQTKTQAAKTQTTETPKIAKVERPAKASV